MVTPQHKTSEDTLLACSRELYQLIAERIPVPVSLRFEADALFIIANTRPATYIRLDYAMGPLEYARHIVPAIEALCHQIRDPELWAKPT